MNNLGACYHNGFGCKQEMARAIHWYRQAARAGCTEALDNLGRCYKEGNGVQQDLDRAADIFRQAAMMGHPKAGERLAEMGLKLEA